MKETLQFQISRDTAVKCEESVRVPLASSQMLLEIGLGKECAGMGYVIVRDPAGNVRLVHLIGHGEHRLLLGMTGRDTSVGGVPGIIIAGTWSVELMLFTEYIAQFLGDRVVPFAITVETFVDETAEEDGKMPFAVEEVIGEQVWVNPYRVSSEGVLPELVHYDWEQRFCPEAKWYKGDFHTHTTLSDGKETTASATEKAKFTELDFYVPTEHNAIHTGWHDARLLVVPGIEMTTERGHCNFFGIDRMPANLLELMEHVNDEQSEAFMCEAVTEANARNWIVSVNHPFLHIWKWKHYSLKLRNLQCLEVINDPTYPYAEEANKKAVAFLDLLWSDGWKIWGVGGSDSHNLLEERYEGSKLPSIAGDPGTFVYCEGLSAKELLNRVRRGNMYVSRFCKVETAICCGRHSYLPGDEITGKDTCKGENISLRYAVRVSDMKEDIRIFLVQDGRRELLKAARREDGSVLAEKKITIERGLWSYIRVEVENAAGELRAYINPVFHGSKTHRYTTFGEAVEAFER